MELRLNLFSYSYIEKQMKVDMEAIAKQQTKKYEIIHDKNAGFNHSNADTLFRKEMLNSQFYE